MLRLLRAALGSCFASRSDLVLENLALRQQLAVFSRKTSRPRIKGRDWLLCAVLSRCWPRWKQAPIIVQPDTLVRWHREGFRRYWR